MPTISLKTFAGLRPLSDPILLAEPEATVANNVKLVSGTLAPLLGTTTLKATTKSNPTNIWRYGTDSNESNYWLEFASDTDVVMSPISADPFQRIYWADGSQIKMGVNSSIISGASYPGSGYILGVPAPVAAPVISGTVPSVASTSTTLTAVYTYVSAYGEEGLPSSAAVTAIVDPAHNITVSGMSSAPTGNYNIATKRIYLSSTVGNQAQFQFWKEVPVGTTTVSDAYNQSALGEILPSEYWNPPPAALKGIKMTGISSMIGFDGNTAYLSEPNLPHAFPHIYPIDMQIVGIGVFGQSAVLLTNGYPYLMYGADPQAMSTQKLAFPWACLSKRSIVDTGDGTIYASADGLVMISGSGMSMLTKQIFTIEQWRALNPSSISAALYNHKYFFTFTRTDGSRGLYVIDLSGQGALLVASDLNSSTAITAMYADPRTDTLYLVQGGNIVRWDRGSALTYTWRSKTFRAPYPMNFGVAQVLANAYPVTLNVYADGVQKASKTVAGAEIVRLPSGYRARDWQIEIVSANTVTEANMATSVDEIRSV